MTRTTETGESPWQGLPTEARHPDSRELDRKDTGEIVALLLDEDRRGLEAARRQSESIAAVADAAAAALAGGGVVLFAGAGTSGRLGVLEAAEIPPTFGVSHEKVRAVMAGGDAAVFRAQEGAEDSEDEGRAAARALGAGDLAIAVSASSVTAFARAALIEARARGARTALVTCAGREQVSAPNTAGGTAAAEVADLVVTLDTGPEILTGSTRLKAGSATKAALNAITTAAMVRLGKTFENLMVDLRPGSAKLRDRARRILAETSGLTLPEAERLAAAASGELKTAIVMARLGIDAEDARRRLEAEGGHVWRALAAR